MWKKLIGYSLLTILTLGGAGFSYLYFRTPASRPPSSITARMTAERIERGRYLYTLADCDGCHAPHDNSKLYFPAIEAKRGAGQEIPEDGAPGRIVAPNITPDRETGIGSWTDGEKIRAIREGISKDGRALFPMMPYELFRNMSDDDVESLVAYLNTLRPVNNALPRTQIDFPSRC